MCGNIIVTTPKVWKDKSKIAKWKGINNFKLNDKKVKFCKAIKHINTQYLAHFVRDVVLKLTIFYKIVSRQYLKIKRAKKYFLTFSNALTWCLKFFLPFTFCHLWFTFLLSGKKKSCIRETKHLSTDADSSTDAIGGWTKNTQKPDFFEKRKKLPKTQKLRNV